MGVFDNYECYGQLSIFDVCNCFQAKQVDIRGICDDGYCPNCGIWLEDLIEYCPDCNQKLDWEEWKRLNV